MIVLDLKMNKPWKRLRYRQGGGPVHEPTVAGSNIPRLESRPSRKDRKHCADLIGIDLKLEFIFN